MIEAAAYKQLNKLKAVLESIVELGITDRVFVKVNRNSVNIFHLAATSSCDCDMFIYLLKFASSDLVKLKKYLPKKIKVAMLL